MAMQWMAAWWSLNTALTWARACWWENEKHKLAVRIEGGMYNNRTTKRSRCHSAIPRPAHAQFKLHCCHIRQVARLTTVQHMDVRFLTEHKSGNLQSNLTSGPLAASSVELHVLAGDDEQAYPVRNTAWR